MTAFVTASLNPKYDYSNCEPGQEPQPTGRYEWRVSYGPRFVGGEAASFDLAQRCIREEMQKMEASKHEQ